MHNINDTVIEEANKPGIIPHYNETKCDVDTLDQIYTLILERERLAVGLQHTS